MPSLLAKLESILFYATKPVSRKALLKYLQCGHQELEEVITGLKEKHSGENSGLRIIDHDDNLQFSTSAEVSDLIKNVYQAEMTGELTKPALETLTIIAYRGPITKPELEMIRGINCSMIIRNLMMRGLIKEEKDKTKMIEVYTADPEFLQFLGLTSVKELPDYENLSSHKLIEELLNTRA